MKKGLISLVAASMLASSAMAVNVAQDGTGDLLIAPYISVHNNFNSVITLVNTDRRHSYYIRGVFKEGKHSAEVSDITIVLSPGDTWTGTIRENGILYTSDDSLYNYEELLKTEQTENPGEVKVASISNSVSNGYFIFYVVFQSREDNNIVRYKYFNDNRKRDEFIDYDVNTPGVPKHILKAYFYDAAYGKVGKNKLEVPSPSYEILNNVDVEYTNPKLDGVNINNNAIMGLSQLLQKDSPTVSASLPMYALENAIVGYDNEDDILKSYEMGKDTNPCDYINKKDVLNAMKVKETKYAYEYVPGEKETMLTLTYVYDENSKKFVYAKNEIGETICVEKDSDRREVQYTIFDNDENYVTTCPNDVNTLYNMIEQKYNYDDDKSNDIANPGISPYAPPRCRVITDTEVSKLTVGRMKSGMMQISYVTRETQLQGGTGYTEWKDFDIGNVNSSGWIVLNNVWNDYHDWLDEKDDLYLNIHYDIRDKDEENNGSCGSNEGFGTGGQLDILNNVEAVYIPTIMSIKYINGGEDPVFDWYYPAIEKY